MIDAPRLGFFATIREWNELVPSHFQTPAVQGCRIAKDEQYLHSVMDAWNTESEQTHVVEVKPVHYQTSNDDPTFLHGHFFRRRKSPSQGRMDLLPVVLFFHTAAGPQDVFLFYKADVLLQNFDCVVMICDLLSDADGWAWDSDRTRYNQVRQSLMDNEAQLLKRRVLASVESICDEVPDVDHHRITAMGWCLGGQPILELARLNNEHSTFSVQAMVTFHGVFARDSFPSIPSWVATKKKNRGLRMLICNGANDPFVTPDDLREATEFLDANGFEVEILQLQNAKHGFTNPAQDFNPNSAFGFCKIGSIMAWTKAQELIQNALS